MQLSSSFSYNQRTPYEIEQRSEGAPLRPIVLLPVDTARAGH